VLLLDELTTFLDYEDQLNVLRCVRRIVDGAHDARSSSSSSSSSAKAAAATVAALGGEVAAAPPERHGVTALWVTHRLEELRYADGVSVMDEGRIVFNGSAQQAADYLKRMGANP
jgi:ABC-type cobalamin/Fe3+-siderophores transport system ATPase subunit